MTLRNSANVIMWKHNIQPTGNWGVIFNQLRKTRAYHIWFVTGQWASCQIRKIAGCACAGNAGKVFPRGRLQRKLLVSDPDMHHGTCVTHVPWCMSGSLNRGGGENVPGIPGACASRNITYLARGPLRASARASCQIRKIAGRVSAGNAGNIQKNKKPIGFFSDNVHVHAVMHAGIANQRFPFNSVVGKTFPAFPAHAQPVILRILYEAHPTLVTQRLVAIRP